MSSRKCGTLVSSIRVSPCSNKRPHRLHRLRFCLHHLQLLQQRLTFSWQLMQRLSMVSGSPRQSSASPPPAWAAPVALPRSSIAPIAAGMASLVATSVLSERRHACHVHRRAGIAP